MTTPTLQRLDLRGLELAPSQTWSSVRLVPILRRDPPGDLRLAKRSYDESAMVVSLDGPLLDPGVKYIAYVPHGLVVSWTGDGSPAASYGTNMVGRDGKRFGSFVRVAHRMAKREDGERLRLLPLHLAMEGFLALHFGGPDVAWSEYSKRALSRGLSPRSERVLSGRSIIGLEDALRVFEIHDRQVGVLVFVAEAFASAFIVSHPDDYRPLHRTLLEDFYGELLYQYGLYGATWPMDATLDSSGVSTLDDLGRALDTMYRDWAEFHEYMAAGIFDRPLSAQHVYQCGPFRLQRFVTDLDLKGENHIGEAIVRPDGTIEYLKTFRLSATQTRRAALLGHLADHDWNLDRAAEAAGVPKAAYIRRLERVGFGYLLAEHVLRAAQKQPPR
ncbi:ARPP-2 domain-containing protein [Haliangium sp.]|uniref:ARPP-2 domain-containing protein n=1 Tax=Haliangium sp. TaxID=2663208 RepID=UPI003D0D04A9